MKMDPNYLRVVSTAYSRGLHWFYVFLYVYETERFPAVYASTNDLLWLIHDSLYQLIEKFPISYRT